MRIYIVRKCTWEFVRLFRSGPRRYNIMGYKTIIITIDDYNIIADTDESVFHASLKERFHRSFWAIRRNLIIGLMLVVRLAINE